MCIAARQDLRSFLDLVEKLHDQEHATDAAEREVFSRLMGSEVDAKSFNVATSIARDLEDAGDSLLRAGRLIAGRRFESSAQITLDGETGRVYAGTVEVAEERPDAELAQVAAWGKSSMRTTLSS